MIIIDRNGKTLLTRRSQKISYPGAWVFPGGAIDKNEQLVDAAQRELWEECGIKCEKHELSPVLFYETALAINEHGTLNHRHRYIMFYV